MAVGVKLELQAFRGLQRMRIKEMQRVVRERAEFYNKNITNALDRRLLQLTLAVHRTAIKLIQKRTMGERTIRYVPRRSVTVSKPYGPPNTDTGRLIGSVMFIVDKNTHTGAVGSGLKYASYLEFGAKSINLQRRPWLRPAFRIVTGKKPKWPDIKIKSEGRAA